MYEAAETRATASTKPETSVKDTIESILIAFILAFIFRAFIVEAFVIPTGSMATTLLGAHMRFTCQDCGWQFTVNYSGEQVEGDIQIPSLARVQLRDRNGAMTGQSLDQVFAVHCPNCGYRIPRRDDANPDDDATAPPVHFGDRILVLKYVYLFNEPSRWDVVVFKSPDSDRRDYSQNYIKRLIGRPGESIVLLDGDVYVGPADATSPGQFKIARKPRVVQEALWRIVYDHDFQPPPKGLPRDVTNAANQIVRVEPAFRVPWRQVSGSGWGVPADNPRVFTFDNAAGSGTLEFDADANPTKFALTDWLSYDVTVNQTTGHGAGARPPFDLFDRGGYVPGHHPLHNVSDVKLQFFHERLSGDGPLRIHLSRQSHRFVVELEPGRARLLHATGDGTPSEVSSADVPARRGPVRVELVHADYRLALRLDGREVLAFEYEPDPAQLIADDVAGRAHPRPRIAIEADRQAARIAHLGLWRDVYYSSRTENLSFVRRGSPKDFPGNIVRLGPEEYFVLGDNPLISGDARSWTNGVNLPRENLFVEPGRVPARFVLGKAFFVYWPAGFRPFSGAPGIIPNFGDMRFIH